MSDVTEILASMQAGDEAAAGRLFEVIYDELKQIAAQKMAHEAAGHTLQPTALVHEAWLRLGGDEQPGWQNRAHFFGAASEAMRRILVDRARRKGRLRHGGGQVRVDANEVEIAASDDATLLGVSDALEDLAKEDPAEAEVVKLRFFVGMTNDQVAEALGISEKSVRRYWTHARAWLLQRLRSEQ